MPGVEDALYSANPRPATIGVVHAGSFARAVFDLGAEFLHSVLAVCSDLPTGDYDRWRVDGVPEFHLEELLLNTPGCFTKCLRSWNESVGEWDLNLVSLELDKEFFRATGRMLDECLSEQR